jgi:glycosyltransferase involved in cell wall biosynthesis
MPNLLIFTSVLPRLLGARLILDVHDLMPANYMAKFHVDDRHWLVRLLVLEQRVSAMMANYVFCADHSQGEFIERICGVPRRKLFVLLNLPNEDTFKPIKKARRNDVFELVYHGTIAHRLGIDILLRALAHLPDDLPVRLSIYGNGDFLDQARRLAEELRLGDRVYFSASFFPVEAIPEMVGSMDLGVVGNRRTLACDKFMLPVKLLEYVYLGVPVVAPRLEIIRRYFDEEMIKFYEPEDSMDLARCIVELYESPRERDLMARNASRFYDAYNWHAQAAAYLRLLSEQRA